MAKNGEEFMSEHAWTVLHALGMYINKMESNVKALSDSDPLEQWAKHAMSQQLAKGQLAHSALLDWMEEKELSED